jgi:uncharacterized protein YcbK (DUF882 family)
MTFAEFDSQGRNGHFLQSEFVCKCGCGLDTPDAKLIDALNELRDLVGRPITITGPLRCNEHNAATPGASPDSRHTTPYCDAVDIRIKGMSVSQMARAALMIPAFASGGIGLYINRIHVDTRGYSARWTVKTGLTWDRVIGQ